MERTMKAKPMLMAAEANKLSGFILPLKELSYHNTTLNQGFEDLKREERDRERGNRRRRRLRRRR